MEARQEVRLKQAEAAGQKMRLTETRSLNQPTPIIGFIRGLSIAIGPDNQKKQVFFVSLQPANLNSRP